ncbi:TetR family transcriptional regulator [Vibrio chagasii]|nr:TetR family transcriptional regulator [Vibrio chagasii]
MKNTREKIIYGALELFNQHGERGITTNHIAVYVEVSPGNLYYYFRNKQEIVRAIFTLYSDELQERFTPIKGYCEALPFLKHNLDSMFTLMWKYRFFYASLPETLSRDEQLRLEYIATQERLNTNLIDIMRVFVQLGFLKATEQQIKETVTTLHLIASNWLTYRSAISPQPQITKQLIHQGMLQMIIVVKPLATTPGLKQLVSLEESIKVLSLRDESKEQSIHSPPSTQKAYE